VKILKTTKLFSLTIISILCLSLFAIMLPSVDATKPVPGISVTTSTNRSSPLIVGDIVTFIFTVTNTGKDRLTDISVVNDVVGPAVFQSGDKRNNGILESSEAWIFTSAYIVTATPNPLINTVTVTANYRGGSVSNSEVYNIEVLGEDGLLPDILTSPNQELSGGWYGCSVATGEGLIVVGAAYESMPLDSVTVTAKKPHHQAKSTQPDEPTSIVQQTEHY
jgi:uncharacterized repeat protein (TIGR01451 family)